MPSSEDDETPAGKTPDDGDPLLELVRAFRHLENADLREAMLQHVVAAEAEQLDSDGARRDLNSSAMKVAVVLS